MVQTKAAAGETVGQSVRRDKVGLVKAVDKFVDAAGNVTKSVDEREPDPGTQYLIDHSSEAMKKLVNSLGHDRIDKDLVILPHPRIVVNFEPRSFGSRITSRGREIHLLGITTAWDSRLP